MTPQPPLDAYRRAIYRIEAPEGALDLRVGSPSPALDRLLAARGARRWAVLTAENPGSRPLPAARNAGRTARLRARLERTGRAWLPGRNLDPDGRWPEEASCLVLDPAAEEAEELARAFGQAAILLGESGGAPRLLVLDRAGGAQAPPRRGSSRELATVNEASPSGSPSSSNSTE